MEPLAKVRVLLSKSLIALQHSAQKGHSLCGFTVTVYLWPVTGRKSNGARGRSFFSESTRGEF